MFPLSRFAWLFAFAPIFSSGCGSEPKMVPVSGIVMIDGQPLTHGKIQVAPANTRPAFGTIGPDGRFTLGTYSENDGLPVGTHPVAIIAHEAQGPGAQKWHAPKKYMSTETSGLTITVEKATPDAAINITWDGGKPFVEKMAKE